MVYVPLLFGQICVIIEFTVSTWALVSLLLGSRLKSPYLIFPKYKLPLKSPIALASLGVFFHAFCFGLSGFWVAFTRQHFENAALKCDISVRICVFSFIMTAGFTYIFLLVKVQTTKFERLKRSLIEWILSFGLLGVPILVVCGVIYLPGNFLPAYDGSTSTCVIGTENWGVYLAFSLADWSFNLGFFIVFGTSLRSLILSQKNANGSDFAERAQKLVAVATKNFKACLLCVIPASVQITMFLYSASTSNVEVAVISEALSQISLTFFVISVIYSTSKAWNLPCGCTHQDISQSNPDSRRISHDIISGKGSNVGANLPNQDGIVVNLRESSQLITSPSSVVDRTDPELQTGSVSSGPKQTVLNV